MRPFPDDDSHSRGTDDDFFLWSSALHERYLLLQIIMATKSVIAFRALLVLLLAVFVVVQSHPGEKTNQIDCCRAVLKAQFIFPSASDDEGEMPSHKETPRRARQRRAILIVSQNKKDETLLLRISFFFSGMKFRRIHRRPVSVKRSSSNLGGGFVCRRMGFFANEADCTLFYRCVDYWGDGRHFTLFRFRCPAGTIFDPSLSVCNHPGWVQPPRQCAGATPPRPPGTKKSLTSHAGGLRAVPAVFFFFFLDVMKPRESF